MSQRPPTPTDPSVEAFFLGKIDFEACLALQRRLVFEAGGRADGQIALLLCEHPGLITVGRLGSRAHIHLSPRELTSRRLEVSWVNRGGGCLLHAPGQLAVYPIVPLWWHRFTVGEYLNRLQSGILATLNELGIAGQTRAGSHGIWGRTGQLVAFGAAVKNWTTYYGAYINVDPARAVLSFGSSPAGRPATSPLGAGGAEEAKKNNVRRSNICYPAGRPRSAESTLLMPSPCGRGWCLKPTNIRGAIP